MANQISQKTIGGIGVSDVNRIVKRDPEKILDQLLKEIDSLQLFRTNPAAHKRIMLILESK